MGLHFRVKHSLVEAINKARLLGLPLFQCFFVDQTHKKMLDICSETQLEFMRFAQEGNHIFVHGSYWITLASLKRSGFKALLRELELAQRLSCSHLIIHPGSATGGTRQEGIEQVACLLNKATCYDYGVKVVLENTMHGNLNVGSDIEDFAQIKERLNKPEQIGFCIDTAHAYAYGYDVKDSIGQQNFIALVDAKIGLDSVEIIHLNDSHKPLGSQIDKHAVPGEGLIGLDSLRSFALHPQLCTIPLVLELPVLTDEQEIMVLNTVRSWH